MIFVAPDKFKGTLTAQDFCAAAADVFGRDNLMCAPMADGGEGTAEILMPLIEHKYQSGWHRVAVVESARHIGTPAVAAAGLNVITADSTPLGIEVANCLARGFDKVFVAVGGTGTCDAGRGFAEYLLARFTRKELAAKIEGIIDVCVPLLAPCGSPSALMFAPQKGASSSDIPLLRKRLEEYAKVTARRSEFDGAGGGLGFALTSVIGCPCHRGAEFVLECYHPDPAEIDMVITGEGKLDAQTATGKVVDTLYQAAMRWHKPVAIVAGTVESAVHYPEATIISCDRYSGTSALTPEEARTRLYSALCEIKKQL